MHVTRTSSAPLLPLRVSVISLSLSLSLSRPLACSSSCSLLPRRIPERPRHVAGQGKLLGSREPGGIEKAAQKLLGGLAEASWGPLGAIWKLCLSSTLEATRREDKNQRFPFSIFESFWLVGGVLGWGLLGPSRAVLSVSGGVLKLSWTVGDHRRPSWVRGGSGPSVAAWTAV